MPHGRNCRGSLGVPSKLQMFLSRNCIAARPNLQAEGAVPKYGHKLAALRRRQVDAVLGRSGHALNYHGRWKAQPSRVPTASPRRTWTLASCCRGACAGGISCSTARLQQE